MKSIIQSSLLVTTVALALPACVTNPYNDQWVLPQDVDFQGYAQNPGATVEIQAFDRWTNTWMTIDTATATTTPTTYGGETLYAWNLYAVDTTDTGFCVWGDPAFATCPVPAGSSAAEFRVREVGGRTLTTFEDGGAACVIDSVTAGANWFSAAISCASGDTPIITLRWLT